MLRVLLQNSSHKMITLTTGLVNRAIKQPAAGLDMLDLLQENSCEVIEIDEELLQAVMRSFDGGTVRRTLKYYRQTISLSKDLLVAIVQNRMYSNEIALVLINHSEHSLQIPEEAVSLIADFLSFHVLTETVRVIRTIKKSALLADAVANQRYGDEEAAGILKENPACAASKATILAAARNRPLGGNILRLLFAHAPSIGVKSLVVAAATNVNHIADMLHSFWIPDDSSHFVGDIEERVNILLDHYDVSQPLPDETLEGLLYDDATQGRILYHSAMNVITIL